MSKSASHDVKSTRRSYLKFLGLGAVGLAAPVLTAQPGRAAQHLPQAQNTRPMMGTTVTVTVLDPSRDKAAEAVQRALDTMQAATPLLDRHQSSTPLGELNASGRLKEVPPELAAVLYQAGYFYSVSQRAFDPSILPLLNLTKNAFASNDAPPSAAELRRTQGLVGFDRVTLGPDGVALRDGMQLTLDGVAKGYIIDQAANSLQQMGVRYALINAGGDIRAMAGKGPDEAWEVGIKDPRGEKPFIQTLSLTNGALATSGNYENYFDSQKIHHHIIDSGSGHSPQGVASVSVLAPTVAEADALSTALFVKPRPKAVTLAQSLPHTEALLLGPDLRDTSTPGWPGRWA